MTALLLSQDGLEVYYLKQVSLSSLCICQEVLQQLFTCLCVHVHCESVASEYVLKVQNRTSLEPGQLLVCSST